MTRSASLSRLAALTLSALMTLPGTTAVADDAGNQCIAPISYLPLDPAMVGRGDNGVAALGTYERVSPDGRYILRSYSGAQLGRVSIMELPATGTGVVRVIKTPFGNEAFPVQGSWRYLVDVDGAHYRFADVLRFQNQARPLFKGGMTGFYAAASELGADPEESLREGRKSAIFIRSLSWPQQADSDLQGVGPLQVSTLEVEDDGKTARVVNADGPRFICGHRVSTDGGVYALPMISADGTEFSAIPQVPRIGRPTMRVYGLNLRDASGPVGCDLRADLGFSPGKAVFGDARGLSAAWLTYSDLGYVYIHDRTLARSFKLDHGKHRVLASAFPGLTRDGRVIYGATWRDCADSASCPERAGYVIVDPFQSLEYRAYWQQREQAAPKTCVTAREVETERARFARAHGLSQSAP